MKRLPAFLSMLLIAVVMTGAFSTRSSGERWLTVYYITDGNPAKTVNVNPKVIHLC